MKINKRCLYNKKSFRTDEDGLCYSCLRLIEKDQNLKTFGEEVSCPYCEHRTVLPCNNKDLLTAYWITQLSKSKEKS